MRLIIAGGGTGGHLYPAIAIAEEWLKEFPKGKVLFVVSRRGLEEKVLQKLGYGYRFISLESLGRVGWFRMPYVLGKSLAESVQIIREFDPHLLLGVGGFSSGPVALAGKLLGKPVFIQEQNIIPGRTNRILAHLASRIYLSYADSEEHFPTNKTVLSGNPVRANLKVKRKEYNRFGFTDDRFTILVFGGSQGSQKINHSIIEATAHLAEVQDRIQILHITGQADLESVKKCYTGFRHYVTEYLMEMEEAYAIADLVICRSGATTLAEITALGKSSVLVPYPHATGDHQTKNADFLVRAGAAVKITDAELDGKRLARLIIDYLDHPNKLKEMESKSRKLGSFDGAKIIVCSMRDNIPK